MTQSQPGQQSYIGRRFHGIHMKSILYKNNPTTFGNLGIEVSIMQICTPWYQKEGGRGVYK